MMDDSGEAWKAGVPDAVWASETDEDEVVVSDSDASDLDDADSDFDSDEDLSGDEEVVMMRLVK
jgi:hypothetical protein